MRYHFLMAVYVTNFCNVHKSDVWTLAIYSAGSSEPGGGGRQILARIEENTPDSNGIRLQIPTPHPPGFLDRPTALYMPRAMRTFLMSYI